MAVREATAEELEQALAEGVQLVDVRTPGEFGEGHVPGAVNVPLEQISDAGREWPGRRVWLICPSGVRSSRAAQAPAYAKRNELRQRPHSCGKGDRTCWTCR